MESDWTSYEYRRPPAVLCQFWREGWDAPITCKPSELNPQLNIVGLRWRLTGAGREYLESLPEAVRQQMEPMPYSHFWQQVANMSGSQGQGSFTAGVRLNDIFGSILWNTEQVGPVIV